MSSSPFQTLKQNFLLWGLLSYLYEKLKIHLNLKNIFSDAPKNLKMYFQKLLYLKTKNSIIRNDFYEETNDKLILLLLWYTLKTKY